MAGLAERRNWRLAASEPEFGGEALRAGVMLQHFAVEALACVALRGITLRGPCELAPRCADHPALACPDGDVETQIGAVHLNPASDSWSPVARRAPPGIRPRRFPPTGRYWQRRTGKRHERRHLPQCPASHLRS